MIRQCIMSKNKAKNPSKSLKNLSKFHNNLCKPNKSQSKQVKKLSKFLFSPNKSLKNQSKSIKKRIKSYSIMNRKLFQNLPNPILNLFQTLKPKSLKNLKSLKLQRKVLENQIHH